MKLFVSLLFCLPAFLVGNPEGPAVVTGEVHFSNPTAHHLEVHAGHRAIINWKDFSIKQGEITSFIQPGRHAAVLNRVLGNMPSQINGLLKAEGHVYLINPQGTLIGKEGVIQTAGFVASTFDVLDDSFLKNQELLFQGDSTAAIINYGTIEAWDGDVMLLGRSVVNQGQIRAPKGEVNLAAGHEILLKPEGRDRIYISLANHSGEKEEVGIDTSGRIEAVSAYLKAEGNAYALAIKQSGEIEATATVEKEGRIYLVAEGGVNQVSGHLTAKGGKIHLLGDKVGLTKGGFLDVSGDLGGGEVLIGGDYQGNNPEILNATLTVVEKETLIDASAKLSGKGGKVVLWSDEACSFAGTIRAEGGAEAGDGGLVEISGKQHLNFDGLVSTLAPKGKMGTLLLDPTDVVVSTAADSNNSFNGGSYSYSAATSNINNLTLQMNLLTTSVTISTASLFVNPPNGGSISVIAPINWATDSSLSFIANNNINLLITGTTPGTAAINNSSSGGISFQAQNNIMVGGTDSATSPVVATATGPLSFQTIAGDIVFQPAPASFVTIAPNAGDFSISAGEDLKLIAANGSAVDIMTSTAGFNLFSAGRDLILQAGGVGETVQISVPPNVTSLLEFTNVGRNVSITGGSGMGSFAAIGGLPIMTAGAALSNILFDSVGGNFTLQGGSDPDAFAQVGHTTDNLMNLLSMEVVGDIGLSIGGTLSVLGGSGGLAIVGMGSKAALVANETLESNISVIANIVQVTGGSGTDADGLIGFMSSATATSGITGSVDVKGTSNVFIQGGTVADGVIGYAQVGSPVVTIANLPIDISANGLLQMDAPGAGEALIQNGLSPMAVPSNINIHVNNALIGTGAGTPGNVEIYSGHDLIFIADQNIHLGAISNVHTVSGQISLVVDNQAPHAPKIGNGEFIIDPGAVVTTAGPLRIFTATRTQNQIHAPLNGALFVPGPLFLDSATEQWESYYFDPFGGFPFTIFYKDALPEYQNAYGIAISEALRDLTPYDELIFVRIPFCLRYDRCNMRLDHYPKSALSGYDFANDEGYDMLRQQYRNYNTKYAESL